MGCVVNSASPRAVDACARGGKGALTSDRRAKAMGGWSGGASKDEKTVLRKARAAITINGGRAARGRVQCGQAGAPGGTVCVCTLPAFHLAAAASRPLAV